MDRLEPSGSDARRVFLLQAGWRVVRVGVAFGCDLRRPERDVGTPWRRAAERPAAERDVCGPVPGGAAQGECGNGDRGDDCGGGGLVGELAGAAPPVHAAVRGCFLRGPGADAGRADAMAAIAVPGA